MNLIGGVTYPGLEKPWDKEDSWTTAFDKFFHSKSFWHSFAGAASAVSPAKLTYSGVIQLGYDPILAFSSMIANLLLSGTLGAIGVSNVVANIKNFYRGGYSPIIVREVELLIYTLLALILTSARSYAVGEMIYSGDEWVRTLNAYGLSTILNLPETLMFITAFTGLRIKIHEALQARNFPNTFIGIVAFILAILFAISFFKSFAGLTDRAWQLRYSTWFDVQGVAWIDQIVSSGGGLGASLLVVGEGSTIEATMRYLYNFTLRLPKNLTGLGNSLLKHCHRTSTAVNTSVSPTEYTALLMPENTTPVAAPFILGEQEIIQGNANYKFFGTPESFAAAKRAQNQPTDFTVINLPGIGKPLNNDGYGSMV